MTMWWMKAPNVVVKLSVNAIYNNKVAVFVYDYLLATSLVQVGKTYNYAYYRVVSGSAEFIRRESNFPT